MPQQGETGHAERDAFDRALAPCYAELLQAAQREVRHRLALGQFAPGDPTPEQLLDAALQHAWRERRRLSPALGIKAWALASIFRTGEALGAREAARRRKTTSSLRRSSPTRSIRTTTRSSGNRMSSTIPKVRKSSAARSIARPRTTTSLSAGSLRASVKSCSMHEVHGVALPEV